MKLKQLIEIYPALLALGNTKLPARVGFRVAKAINIVKPEIAAYEDQRSKLMQEHGTLSEDGSQYNFVGAAMGAFAGDINALVDEECDVALPAITEAELADVNIEPATLAALLGVVVLE